MALFGRPLAEQIDQRLGEKEAHAAARSDRASPVTRCPARWSSGTTAPPIQPDAPVTRMFMLPPATAPDPMSEDDMTVARVMSRGDMRRQKVTSA